MEIGKSKLEDSHIDGSNLRQKEVREGIIALDKVLMVGKARVIGRC